MHYYISTTTQIHTQSTVLYVLFQYNIVHLYTCKHVHYYSVHAQDTYIYMYMYTYMGVHVHIGLSTWANTTCVCLCAVEFQDQKHVFENDGSISLANHTQTSR